MILGPIHIDAAILYDEHGQNRRRCLNDAACIPAKRQRKRAMPSTAPGLYTHLVHPDYDGMQGPPPGPVTLPLDRTSTYRLAPEGELALATGERGETTDVYGRWGTSTTREAARIVARLEGAQAALLLSSGAAATAVAFAVLLPHRGRVAVARELFGGTENYIREQLLPLGTVRDRFDPARAETLESLLMGANKPDLVWCEALSNPTIRVAAISRIGALCRAADVPLVVDSTFAAGMLVRPLDRGASLVLHSASKFINGHSDVVAGALCGSHELVRRCWAVMVRLGGCIDPMGAWLLARGVRTLPLRFARQSDTAMRLAQRLSRHAKVLRVHYPGLASDPHHELARDELTGFGAIFAFDVRDAHAALQLARSVRLCSHATSLGGIETLVSIPARSSHANVPKHDRERLGILDGTIRVSVGLEDFEDLWLDLERALEA